MQTDAHAFRTEFRRDLDRLERLRDEIRVRIHLGGLDAREQFQKLEAEASRLGHEANVATHRALRNLIKQFEELDSIV